MNNGKRIVKVIKLSLFPVVLAGIVILYLVFRDKLHQVFHSIEALSDWVQEQHSVSWLIFIVIQVLQVIVFIIPGEITQIAGGYLFGVLGGFVLSISGILIGSCFNFFLARFSGIEFIKKIIGKKRYNSLTTKISEKSQVYSFFVFFLIPGIPKDILCYLAGLSNISFWEFLIISFAGRLPGIVGSVLIGSALIQQNTVVTLVLFIIAFVLLIIGIVNRKKLIESIKKRGDKKN